MSIENLRGALPEYAKDQKLNLGTLTRSTELSEQQLWGTLLASAAATRNAKVIAEIAEEAKEHLSEEAVEAAYGAATVMAMNNVAYRAKGWLGDDYAQVKFGLRMNIISKPGVEKVDFELWSLAVSAINGCGQCLDSHEQVLRKAGVDRDTIQEAFKIASVIQAVAVTLDAEAALAAE